MTDPGVAATIPVPGRWEDVTAEWMTAALACRYPDNRVDRVELLLRDDGTNRRARFGMTYAAGTGPSTVFVKAESDVEGRREIHAQNGNLFNEPLLFQSGAPLPVEHPQAFAAVVDEATLDYVVVFEDLIARGADPLDATRPLTVTQVADGLRGLAQLHSRYWERVQTDALLTWVQPFLPTKGWQGPIKFGAPKGVERAGDPLPVEVRGFTGEQFLDLWTGYVDSLTTGPQTLLHGDPHIGNTYVLPGGEVGFLDWQVVRSGSWVHDVGYFVQSALTETDRRHHEADLLHEYLDRLDIPGHDRPSADEAWLRYRASAAHGLPLWLITLLSDVHAHERSLALVQRFAAAFVELDSPAAVADLAA